MEKLRLHAIPGGRSGTAREAEGPSDDEVVDGVIGGDDRMAAILYDRVIGPVDRTLYRIFGRRETDHEDLVQTTFEQIVVTLFHQRFARACSLTTWATRVATHVGLNALRSRRRERRVVDRSEPLDTAPETHSSIRLEGTLEARRELERLREHLAAIDPAKAEALFLHDALGHDLAEVALLSGVSVAAAQSRLVRGRKELMERIEADRIAESGGTR